MQTPSKGLVEYEREELRSRQNKSDKLRTEDVVRSLRATSRTQSNTGIGIEKEVSGAPTRQEVRFPISVRC
jgi:hypothetical protein